MERKSLKRKITNGFGDLLVGIQTVTMTELQATVFNLFTIHCFTNSTKCVIFCSGIWPNPNARKWRLQARWGGFPLPWLGGAYAAARQGPRQANLAHGGGDSWPTLPVAGGRLPWRGGGYPMHGTKWPCRVACGAKMAHPQKCRRHLLRTVQARQWWELAECLVGAPQLPLAEEGGL